MAKAQSHLTYNPDLIGFCEKAGWEAYYARDWARVLRLMVRMNRAAFHMPWHLAVLAAADTVRASIAFAPVDNDLATTRRHLAAFFAKARRTVGMRASAERLAELELDYWVIHRALAVQRARGTGDCDIEPMVLALVDLHAAMFDAAPQQVRESAELRALAAATVDEITGRRSQDVAADWRTIEDLLKRAYRSVSQLRAAAW